MRALWMAAWMMWACPLANGCAAEELDDRVDGETSRSQQGLAVQPYYDPQFDSIGPAAVAVPTSLAELQAKNQERAAAIAEARSSERWQARISPLVGPKTIAVVGTRVDPATINFSPVNGYHLTALHVEQQIFGPPAGQHVLLFQHAAPGGGPGSCGGLELTIGQRAMILAKPSALHSDGYELLTARDGVHFGWAVEKSTGVGTYATYSGAELALSQVHSLGGNQ